jgi:hypothetical protein
VVSIFTPDIKSVCYPETLILNLSNLELFSQASHASTELRRINPSTHSQQTFWLRTRKINVYTLISTHQQACSTFSTSEAQILCVGTIYVSQLTCEFFPKFQVRRGSFFHSLLAQILLRPVNLRILVMDLGSVQLSCESLPPDHNCS